MYFGFAVRSAGAILVRFEELMQHLISACRIHPALTRRESSWNISCGREPCPQSRGDRRDAVDPGNCRC
jgi:hypothetical protein